MKTKEEIEIQELKTEFDKLVYTGFLHQEAVGKLDNLALQVLAEIEGEEKQSLANKEKQQALEQKVKEYSTCLEAAQEAGIEKYFLDALDQRLAKKRGPLMKKALLDYYCESYVAKGIGFTALAGGLSAGLIYGACTAQAKWLQELLGIGGFLSGGAAVLGIFPTVMFLIAEGGINIKYNWYEHKKVARQLKEYLNKGAAPTPESERLLKKLNFSKLLKKAAKRYKKDCLRLDRIRELTEEYAAICRQEGLRFTELGSMMERIYGYDWRTGLAINKDQPYKPRVSKVKKLFEKGIGLLREHQEYQHLAGLEGIEPAYQKALGRNPKNPAKAYKLAYEQAIKKLQKETSGELKAGIKKLLI